ncbi:MAG: hypothetical protein ACRC62_03565 [Microcoleus sp.]
MIEYLESVHIPTDLPLFPTRMDQLAATKALRVAINQPWSNRVSLVKLTDEFNKVSMIVLFYIDGFTKEQVEEYTAAIIAHLPT